MQVGDFAKYRNTGTVGKVLDVTQEGQVTWVLLDTYNLYYDQTTLEPAKPEEYREAVEHAKGIADQLQEVERLRESIKEMEERIGRITPSGAG